MKYHRLYLIVPFILLSFFATAQSASGTLTQEEWLSNITGSAIHKPVKANEFSRARPGFALYFTDAGGIKAPYLVYVPASYNPAHATSVVVFLHGAILARNDFQYKDPAIANEPVFSVADTFNTIIIFPFARQDFKWAGSGPAFENIIAIIKQAEEVYNIDKQRIYIGGISMGGNATYWFINNKPGMFAGFYTFSALPRAQDGGVKFANITREKPLYSMNAKDDPVFPYSEAEAVYNEHKNEAPGWHFSSVETGGHRFIYGLHGANYIKGIFARLLGPSR